ncbi:MAG: hypothetical protein WCJ92_08525, partial [Alphaproteobacteria bacterium]
ITGVAAGDSVTFGFGTMTAQAATSVTAATTLVQAIDIACAAAGAVGVNRAAWFNWAGNTYVVDNAAGVTLSAADVVVLLTGTVDLSNSAMAAGVLTIA